MATPNIDAIERYATRTVEYTQSLTKRKRLYIPTIARLHKLRDKLASVLKKLDEILSKFDPDAAPQPPQTLTSAEKSDEITITEERIRELIAEQLKPATGVNSAVPAVQIDKAPAAAEEKQVDKCRSIPTSVKRISSQKVVVAYHNLFKDHLPVHSGSDAIDGICEFLGRWYDTKIWHFSKLKQKDPKLNYNVKWLPQYIRDFVVYLGQYPDKIMEKLKELNEFLDAGPDDPTYTNIVPYDVFRIGRENDPNNCTPTAESIWYQVVYVLFRHLDIPDNNPCACPKSLIIHAYLTPEQIKAGITNEGPEDVFRQAAKDMCRYLTKRKE